MPKRRRNELLKASQVPVRIKTGLFIKNGLSWRATVSGISSSTCLEKITILYQSTYNKNHLLTKKNLHFLAAFSATIIEEGLLSEKALGLLQPSVVITNTWRQT